MPEWTKEQLEAIDSRDGTVLVSAAAGSGKTAVLVERIVRRLADEEKPCSADRLLIVTFTRAATRQMRDRIFRAVSQRLRENPDNAHLKQQLVLLPFAHISTIDSFCNDIVRENFHELNLSPDYKLIDAAQLKILESDAINKAMDEMYKENSAEFLSLVDLLAAGADDSALSQLICRLYNNSMAFARPEIWLDSLAAEYEIGVPLHKSRWGGIIMAQAASAVRYCINLCGKMDEVLATDETAAVSYGACVTEMSRILNELSDKLMNGTWDEARSELMSLKFPAIGRLPKGYSSAQAEYVKLQKKSITELLSKKTAVYFCASQEETEKDMTKLKPVVLKLTAIVKRYGEILNEEKRKVNGVDFSDISHMALKLLVKYDGDGNIEKTPLANSIEKEYDEILVDEFQDINEIQNTLFRAISASESNMFTVGDVKQSIYRFRQAMPEIFLKRRDSLPYYDDGNYPAKITLDRNFRSRRGVTENVNFVFSQLMSKEMGGINYRSGEALVAAADYSRCDAPQTELHILGDLSDGSKVSRETEARHIAQYIEAAIKSGMTVRDNDANRPVTYRDFCILMRATGGGKAEIYSNALAENNIPSYVETKSGFFCATEISTMLNLMRITDNPIQDIPLLAVMLSPIYGFTADELAQMRIRDRKAPLYHCITAAAIDGNKKSAAFLNELKNLRMLSSTLPCSQFVRELYDTTGYSAIVSAMKNGSQRHANLNMLLDYAEKYEESGNRGLSGFIRFIDRVQKRNGDLESASDISEAANVVRIMTIHKSKGLEFPVCILADLSARFNDESSKGICAFHPDYGICFDIRNAENRVRYRTVGKTALNLAERKSALSEELRVLYVAMTRAQERLVCVARCDNIPGKMNSLAALLDSYECIDPFVVSERTCMADWLMMAFVRHPDAVNLRNMLDINDIVVLNPTEQERLKVEIINSVNSSEKFAEYEDDCEADSGLLKEIENRINYDYPYALLAKVRAKISPSEFDSKGFTPEFFASAKPQFLSKSGLNPASRGTATHKFMEFFDFGAESYNVKEQAMRMVAENHITEEEMKALEYEKLEKFFNGEIAERIKNSSLLMREKKVTVAVSAVQLYKELSEKTGDEKIVVQGYVDCAFEENGGLVIVDYKTDRGVTMEELRERYRNQLKMYEFALSECTGEKVTGTLIYSFENGTYISL